MNSATKIRSSPKRFDNNWSENSFRVKTTLNSEQISIISITLPGVITSGLTITEHPAAKAVEIFLEARITGKFHGTKAATTPTG